MAKIHNVELGTTRYGYAYYDPNTGKHEIVLLRILPAAGREKALREMARMQEIHDRIPGSRPLVFIDFERDLESVWKVASLFHTKLAAGERYAVGPRSEEGRAFTDGPFELLTDALAVEGEKMRAIYACPSGRMLYKWKDGWKPVPQ